MIAHVFNNFLDECPEIYELDPVSLLSISTLAWPAALKKTKAKLGLITDIDMVLMVDKGIRGGICNITTNI